MATSIKAAVGLVVFVLVWTPSFVHCRRATPYPVLIRSRPRPPAFYEFGYQVDATETGDFHGHMEKLDGITKTGEFKVRLPDGRMQVVTYQADEAGFRPKVTYETDPNFVPTTDSDSGYYEKPPEVYLLTERPKHYDYKKKKTVKYHRHRPSPTPKYKPSKYEYVTPLPLIEYAPEEVHHSPYEEPVVFVTPKSVPHGYPSPTPTPTPTPIPVLITTTSYEPPHKKYKPPVINYDPRKRQKIHKVKPLAPDAPPPLPPVTKPKYKPGLEVVHDHGHAVPEATTKYEPPPPPSHPPPPPGPTPTPTPDLVHDDTKIQYGPPKTEYTPPTIEYKTYVPPPIHHQHHEQPYHHHPHLVHGKVHESHHVVLPEHPKSPEYLHVYEQQHHKKEPHYYHEEGYRKKYKKPLKPTLTPIIRSEEPDEYLDPYNYKHHHPEQAPYYKHEKEHYHPYQHKHPYEHHPVIDYVPEDGHYHQEYILVPVKKGYHHHGGGGGGRSKPVLAYVLPHE